MYKTRPATNSFLASLRAGYLLRGSGTGLHDQVESYHDRVREIVSGRFEDIIPTSNWMFPAWNTGTPLPDGFSKLRRPTKSLFFDSVEVEQNRKHWIAEWLRAIGG